MNIGQLQCNNCMINKASFYKIVDTTLPCCKCIKIVTPRINRGVYKNDSHSIVSYINTSPENCDCDRRKEYTDFITRTLLSNVHILEFKGRTPEIPRNNNIIWHFLACSECVKDKQLIENYMVKILRM